MIFQAFWAGVLAGCSLVLILGVLHVNIAQSKTKDLLIAEMVGVSSTTTKTKKALCLKWLSLPTSQVSDIVDESVSH